MRYTCLNNISEKGLNNFSRKYHPTEIPKDAELVLVRSHNMEDFPISDKLLAVARAGAGVNNIPLEKMGREGVVVFNTPGANSNAVKELVIASLLMASRDIVGGINWVQANKDSENIAKEVEKAKKQFGGSEILGKTIAVIGLGNVGAKVANACVALGMKVIGYDPFLPEDLKAQLDSSIEIIDNLENIYKQSDFITLHLPLLDTTKHMISEVAISQIKEGCVLLNFSRDLLVSDHALKEALEKGIIRKYITDFPNQFVANLDNVIAIPHLGASTVESEENCAIMAVDQLMRFCENGSIVNSVNYPNVILKEQETKTRILILTIKNLELFDMLDSALADYASEIRLKINKSKNEFAYYVYDIEKAVDKKCIQEIKQINGVYKVRVLTI